MPHRNGSTVNLIDDENCEGTKTISCSIAENKHTSICLDSEEFDVTFENDIGDDDKGRKLLEKHKIVLSLFLVILSIASVFGLIAIKVNDLTKADNIVPISGKWIGHANLDEMKYNFKVNLNFKVDRSFTGIIDLNTSNPKSKNQYSKKINGFWSNHKIIFQSGKYSGTANMTRSNDIHGRWSNGKLEDSFSLKKLLPSVTIL